MFNFNLPLRILQTILAILTLALNGYVTNWYLQHTRPSTTPNQPPFLLLPGALTLLALPYLFLNPALSLSTTSKPPSRLFNKYVVLALDFLLGILYFAGFVALALFKDRLTVCLGYTCNVMIGGVVVGAVAWATFVATAALAVVHVVRTRGASGAEEAKHTEWVGSGKQQTTQV